MFFFRGRVWGLWENNAMSLSKPPTTHTEMILSFLSKNSQKWPILKNRKLKKKIKKYNMIESANKIKLTTQKRQACVSLLI